jgi:hypothetical protein
LVQVGGTRLAAYHSGYYGTLVCAFWLAHASKHGCLGLDWRVVPHLDLKIAVPQCQPR